ncbi:MAG: 23S rRNA (pseudouridine(1915)-N(3))-methyltransferase RlmH, partial [Oscillospiraceae bacterium]|nr:23S rRNA (pseudouridine(1915)-N(3))-methyltransferase RlmH [Oscillospiraceae bacterium]
MQKVNVICVGRLKERFYIDAAAEYMKRLQAFCDLSVIELAEQRLGDAPADAQIERALALEAEAI